MIYIKRLGNSNIIVACKSVFFQVISSINRAYALTKTIVWHFWVQLFMFDHPVSSSIGEIPPVSSVRLIGKASMNGSRR